MPPQILKDFSEELSIPLSDILNKIFQQAGAEPTHTQAWPVQWKTEYVTPIGKVQQPETEDDLRPIALTNFFQQGGRAFCGRVVITLHRGQNRH